MTAFSIDGNEDPWNLLDRVSREDRPLVIRVRDNDELFVHADRTGLAVVRGLIRDEFLADRAMPSGSISDDLYVWEDAINEAIAAQGIEAFALAVVNGDGRKDLLFVTADAESLARCVDRVPVPPMLEPEVERIADPQRWWQLLRSTPLDKQIDGDRAVMLWLEKHGDDGAASRKIEFWFYGERAKLDALLPALQQEGLTPEAELDDPPGLIVSLQSPATPDAFDVLTPRLVALASAHGVEYDGWETEVVTAATGDVADRPSLFRRIFGPKND